MSEILLTIIVNKINGYASYSKGLTKYVVSPSISAVSSQCGRLLWGTPFQQKGCSNIVLGHYYPRDLKTLLALCLINFYKKQMKISKCKSCF